MRLDTVPSTTFSSETVRSENVRSQAEAFNSGSVSTAGTQRIAPSPLPAPTPRLEQPVASLRITPCFTFGQSQNDKLDALVIVGQGHPPGIFQQLYDQLGYYGNWLNIMVLGNGFNSLNPQHIRAAISGRLHATTEVHVWVHGYGLNGRYDRHLNNDDVDVVQLLASVYEAECAPATASVGLGRDIISFNVAEPLTVNMHSCCAGLAANHQVPESLRVIAHTGSKYPSLLGRNLYNILRLINGQTMGLTLPIRQALLSLETAKTTKVTSQHVPQNQGVFKITAPKTAQEIMQVVPYASENALALARELGSSGAELQALDYYIAQNFVGAVVQQYKDAALLDSITRHKPERIDAWLKSGANPDNFVPGLGGTARSYAQAYGYLDLDHAIGRLWRAQWHVSSYAP